MAFPEIKLPNRVGKAIAIPLLPPLLLLLPGWLSRPQRRTSHAKASQANYASFFISLSEPSSPAVAPRRPRSRFGTPTWDHRWGQKVNVSGAILAATGLEALGLGPTRIPTLGITIFWAIEGSAILRGMWWWWGVPIVALIVIFTGLFLMTIGLDEIANPRLRGVKSQ